MNMTTESGLPLAKEAEFPQLPHWSVLSVDEQAFVVAYHSNSYSVSLACEELGWSRGKGQQLLKRPDILKAVKEVQDSVGEIEFLNEKWVKAQLVRLMPMVMGDEAVPLVDSSGVQYEARQFKPDIAMKIIEHVSPKKGGININLTQNNFDSAHLEKLAHRLENLNSGVVYENGEEE